ncbi:MAG TPA: hypothetical protein VJB34_06220 [Bdellovibrionota bacterium]|nr:hypothetical protein [Bdellovibrionota bacterium]
MKKFVWMLFPVLSFFLATQTLALTVQDYEDIYDGAEEIKSPEELKGDWYGFYRNSSTDEFYIMNCKYFNTHASHVVNYWKLFDDDKILLDKGIAEGDFGSGAFWLKDLDPEPVRIHNIRKLDDGTLIGLHIEVADKKAECEKDCNKVLGYYLLFIAN